MAAEVRAVEPQAKKCSVPLEEPVDWGTRGVQGHPPAYGSAWVH